MTIDDGVGLRRAVPEGDRVAALRRRAASGSTASTLAKGAGTITGAAFVGWDSHLLVQRRRPPDSGRARSPRLAYPRAPLSGLAEFTASGSGTFDEPRYDVRFRVNDLFVGEEGVGQVTGTLALRGSELSGEIDAASPRLAVTGTGRIALTPQADAELTFRFHDSSLDPYVRLFVPQLSPFTTAVASGSIRVVGELADLDHLLVDGTVDTLDMRLFDYAVQNAAPIRLALDQQQVQRRGAAARRRGHAAARRRAPSACSDERIALQAAGDANLGILQGFFRDVRGSGRAELTAAVDGPLRAAACSPAARRSPTAASATSRCRTRSTRSTARSASTPAASGSTT